MDSKLVLQCLIVGAAVVIVCGDYVSYTKTKNNKYEPGEQIFGAFILAQFEVPYIFYSSLSFTKNPINRN